MSEQYVHPHFAAWISYLILVAMLLPVISMTDDLQAMVAPTDGEQIVRRCETFASGHAHVPVPGIHGALFISVRDLSLAPVPDVSAREPVSDVFALYQYHRQGTQGRAPPAAMSLAAFTA